VGRLDLSAKQGETLDELVTLYSGNEAEEDPLNLTGSTVEAVLEPYDVGENEPITLVVGNGLTIVGEPTAGQVRMVKLIEASLFDVGLGHWYVKVTTAAGAVSYPRSGKLTIGRP
jgi:hypothetical protein